MSSLPLGLNRIRIERSLTTSALAVFVPFVTQELFMGGDAMYYGLNALSNNMILLDRKQSRSPNGLVFGTPGSGKSMSCKREITFIILTTKDNVIICDPEDEYSPLVTRLGGQVIRLSPSSTDYVNPLDINLNYSDEENPLAVSFVGIISFVGLVAPHIMRRFVGDDYRWLLPCSAAAGSLLLLLADLFSRVVIAPVELPVGAVTSFLGAPVFLYLLLKGGRRNG